jgi:rhamnose utilization protein RhaD (predicted bifunctional aldolase and dehydrogenase)
MVRYGGYGEIGMTELSPPHDLPQLAAASALIGADPLLIQGPGGNTSIKDGGVMWIKASGTNLADALVRDVFVPCDLLAMRQAMRAQDPTADQPALFALQTGGLRPSIETSLHAVFAQRVVVHVHCVNTLAYAIRPDAKAALAEPLSGFDWAIVPYAKPGALLAAQVAAVLGPRTDVVVLANHGLIVAADTVAEAMELRARVCDALRAEPQPLLAPSAALAARLEAGYVELPTAHPLHSVAQSPHMLALATAGSLYPDHVIFCGISATALGAGETVTQAVARVTDAGWPAPAFILVPSEGALIRHDATEGARALAQCLGDVLMRVPHGAQANPLSAAENAELLNWDAEKYRQALNA